MTAGSWTLGGEAPTLVNTRPLEKSPPRWRHPVVRAWPRVGPDHSARRRAGPGRAIRDERRAPPHQLRDQTPPPPQTLEQRRRAARGEAHPPLVDQAPAAHGIPLSVPRSVPPRLDAKSAVP